MSVQGYGPSFYPPYVPSNGERLKEAFLGWLVDVVNKLHEITTSAKFWTMLLSDLSALSMYLEGTITAPMLLAAIVAAGIVYTGAKAYEDAHIIPSAH